MICSFSKKRMVSSLVNVLTVIVCITKGALGTQYETHLVPARNCPGRVISWAHISRTLKARSVLECVTFCRNYIDCLSVAFDDSNKVCYLGNSTIDSNCSNTLPSSVNWKYYEKDFFCNNGGVLNSNQSCTCLDGYHGDECDASMADCEDIFQKGLFTQNGVYYVKPPKASSPFPVYCDYLNSLGLVRTRIANRNFPVADFNCSWHEYREGFGKPNSVSHWLGLRNIHQLTANRNYELRFRVKFPNFTTIYQYYQNFILNDEASGFTMSFDHVASTMTLGDCLTALIGAPFSTYDVDNDGSSGVNCAQQHGAGWWFKGSNCSSCNPFGPIPQPFDGLRRGIHAESFWTNDIGNTIPFPLTLFLVAMP